MVNRKESLITENLPLYQQIMALFDSGCQQIHYGFSQLSQAMDLFEKLSCNFEQNGVNHISSMYSIFIINMVTLPHPLTPSRRKSTNSSKKSSTSSTTKSEGTSKASTRSSNPTEM